MSEVNLPYIIQQSMNRLPFDQSTFYEIARIFNINPENINDMNSKPIMEEKLRNKILDVFHTQGENIKDYLKLPKFNLLKSQSLEKLVDLFHDIWKSYSTEINSQKKSKELKQLQQIIPKFSNLDEIQAFHIQLLNEFKQSKLCPLNKIQKRTNPIDNSIYARNSQYSRQMPFNRNDQSNNYKRPQPQFYWTAHQPSNESFPSFSNNKVVTKIQDEQNNQMYSNQNKYDMQPSSHLSKYVMKSNPNFPIPGLPPQFNYFEKRQNHAANHNSSSIQNGLPPAYNQHHEAEITASSKMQTVYFTGLESELQDKLQKYMFLQCPCYGKYRSNLAYLTCETCHYSFHYKCLLSDESQSVINQCPQCKLKKGSSIFVKIYSRTFAKRWFSKKSGLTKLQFMLTQKEIDDLKSLKLLCKPSSGIQYQLRFQKIIPKNMISQSNNLGDKGKRFNNLPLPSQFIESVRPNNQFEINIKFPQKSEQEENLFIFAIFVVEKFSLQGIVEDLFLNLTQQNSCGQERLAQFQEGKQYIDLNMSCRPGVLIRYPVRGQSCQHAQVFDYMTVLNSGREYGQKFKQLYCPQCDSVCTSIKADRFVYEKIRQMGQEYLYQNCHTLRYSGQGRTEWNPKIQEMSEQSNQQDEDEEIEESSEEQKESTPLSS